MIKLMRLLFFIAVIFEFLAIVLYIRGDYGNFWGFCFTIFSLIILQAGLLYNSKFSIFKK